MADQIKKPSPTHSSSDEDKPTKKRKNPSPIPQNLQLQNLQLHDHDHDHSPPSKRPKKDKQPAKEKEKETEEEEMEDTATSNNPKKKEEQQEEDEDDDNFGSVIDLPDFAIMLSMSAFNRENNGLSPFENSSTMEKFLAPMIRARSFGTPKKLIARLEEVKNKYKGDAEDVAKYGNEFEFQMWKRINWGKKASGSGDDDDKDKGGCS